ESRANISESDCNRYSNNTLDSWWGQNPETSGNAPDPTKSTQYSKKSWTKTGTSWNVNIGTCVRNAITTTTTYNTRYGFTSWSYRPTELDTSALRNGNSLTIAAGYDNRNSNPAGTYATGGSNNYKTEQEIIAAGASSTTISWPGCI